MKPLDLSVAICAFNAERRIPMVLESLSNQETSGYTWELLVVDNASKDNTQAVTKELCQRFNLPFRLLYENEPGLSNARRKACVEASADVVSFLDDDNIVGKDWVQQSINFMHRHPQVGIVGAKVTPVFEDASSIPPNFDSRFAPILSMYDQGCVEREIQVGTDSLPVGAGMTGRREIFRFAFDHLGSIVVGRNQNSLAGGEDFEAMYVAYRLGWQIWYSPSLVAGHFVPVTKLTDQYWEKWNIDTAVCHAWLETLRSSKPISIRILFKNWIRWKRWEHIELVRSYFPKTRQPKPSANFWKRYYRSKARGWMNLLTSYPKIHRFLEELQRLPRAGEQPKLVTS